MPDVVGLALAGRSVAAAHDAAPVPHDEGFELGAGDGAAGPADVQRLDPRPSPAATAGPARNVRAGPVRAGPGRAAQSGGACGAGRGGEVLLDDQAEGGVTGQPA